jgi:A/G-specific adenine glycosylase
MLQQTRVETVIPYYERWMRRFPTLDALARASLQDVLSVWEGLGYYSRARNFHLAAQVVLAEHDGQVPCDVDALRKLPGVGRYTAAAIASLACGADEATLDSNIRRVLSRVFDVRQPARSAGSERRLWELASAHLPLGKAGEYNQALMDLGATLCTPRQPKCPACPLHEMCAAYALGVQEQCPVKAPRRALPHHTVTAAVLRRDERVLIARRPEKGLLGGLWEFPGGKQQDGEDLPACLRRELGEELGVEVAVDAPLGVYQHAYTHFRVTLHAFECVLVGGEPRPLEASELRWVAPYELPDYPMGKIDRQIALQIMKSSNCFC